MATVGTAAQLEQSLGLIGSIAERALGIATEPYGSPEPRMTGKFVLVSFGSSKQIHYDEETGQCYVMVDPPGVTRPCRDDEVTTCQAAVETLKTLKA